MNSACNQIDGPLNELSNSDPATELESVLKDFVDQWNQYTQSGSDPTEFMKEKFNFIQKFHEEPLVGITGEDFVGIKLLYRDSFVIMLEELIESSLNSKRFCLLYERYLEAIGELNLLSKRKGLAKEKGLNPLLIQIDGQKFNLQDEIYFIANSRASGQKLGTPQFNPWGYNYRIFCPKDDSTAFNLIHLLLEEVNIEKKIQSEIIHYLRRIIPDSIGDIGIPTKLFTSKRSVREIKEILRYIFFRSIQGIRLSRCGANINRLVIFHKCSRTRIISIIKQFTKLSNDLPFKLFYLDRSKALTDVITEIKIELQNGGYYNDILLNRIDIKNKQFWKNAKKGLNLTRLAEIFQKAELRNICSLDMDYSIGQALKFRNEKISSDIDHFWNENFSDSFTRLITILIGDPEVRKNINYETKIVLYPHVDSKEVGHAHGANLITKPDVLCFHKLSKGKGGRALESVQIKKLAKIGQNVGELNTIDYITEILKTFAYWDKREIPKTLRRLQIYAIREGDDCNNFTRVTEDVNVIIVAFWGSSSIEAIRINDLIAAIRLENYTKILKCRHREIQELSRAVYKRMNEGSDILNGTEKVILPFSRVVELITNFGTEKTIYSFLYDILFYILETYHESFSE